MNVKYVITLYSSIFVYININININTHEYFTYAKNCYQLNIIVWFAINFYPDYQMKKVLQYE